MSVGRDEDVLWFHVAVDDVFGVEEADGLDDLRDHAADDVLGEGALLHVVVQVARLYVLHDDIHLLGVLERLDDFD